MAQRVAAALFAALILVFVFGGSGALRAVEDAILLHPVTFGLIMLALVAMASVIAVTVWRGAGPAPMVAGLRLRRLHRRSDEPAFEADAAGRVCWANAAAERAGIRRGAPFGPQLRGLFDIGEAELYRLTLAATEVGFSVAPVAERRSRLRRYLAVQSPRHRGAFFSVKSAGEDGPFALLQSGAGFDTSGIGHVSVSADGRISANPRFREMFGAPAKTILDRLPAGHPPQGGFVLLPMADGREALVRVFSIVHDHGERLDYLFYRTSEDGGGLTGWSAALEALPVALVHLDARGRVLLTNTAARTLLGPRLSAGQAFSELVQPVGRPIEALVQAALGETGEALSEMVHLQRDGDALFLQVTLSRFPYSEHDTLLAVLSDASEIRQLEDQFAQSQKMEAVGQLAGGVAHDFNNVLTAISGHCDLLLLGKDISHPDYSDLTQVRQNASRAAALVRQLLAFSRKQALSPDRVSLREVIADAHYLLDRLIVDAVTLRLDQERDLGAVRADRRQLEQVLMNLVVNARDAMPKGGTVTIVTRNLTLGSETAFGRNMVPGGDYVELRVDDEGPGLPEEVIDRVFDPFFTTKPTGQGTGLGLSTVYGVVRQSGGYVAAENRPGGGASFRILLPRIADGAPATERPAAEAGADVAGDMTGQGVVLLVEDEAPVRTFATRALQLRGYRVEAAETAERAMEYLSDAANPVDLIVSDVVMPGLDGPTFAERARALRPGLPVIFVSGYAEDSFRNVAVQDFLFLPKPFSLSELTAKVKEALH